MAKFQTTGQRNCQLFAKRTSFRSNFDQDFRFENFTPTTELDKWAAVEVSDFDNLPDEMEKLILSGGKYAVFAHRGAADSFHQIFQFIFGVLMPNSQYKLDQREHFEILGDNYNPFDPNAEEEIWIPIKAK